MGVPPQVHSHDAPHHDLAAFAERYDWPHRQWTAVMECPECARAVLEMLLNSAQWVMRRVERVRFCDDVSATRRVSMDFFLPASAPRLRVAENRTLCLVPLTVMRRKTLVNFSISDDDGRALPLMSMRHNQVLTEQMLLVLAAATPGVRLSDGVRRFAYAVASGTQEQLESAMHQARQQTADGDLSRLLGDEATRRMIRRLADNFILLVAVDEDGPARRIVRFSYDEPLALKYKAARFDVRSGMLQRAPGGLGWGRVRALAASLGLIPTAIRFPTPAAENSLSYHFEIEAPPGAVITEATLVAARPDDGSRQEAVSWDHVAGGSPVVGLHAVDVRNGSIAAAQVLLRPDRRGWLTTSLLTSLMTAGLLWAPAMSEIEDEATPILAGAMFTVAAAFIVFVVQPAEHQMVSRLVGGVRAAVAFSVLLIGAVALLVTLTHSLSRLWFHTAAIAGTVCALLVLLAFLRARRRRRAVRISPWEQGVAMAATGQAVTKRFESLHEALDYFGFMKPAIMVQTAEAEHLEERWTTAIDDTLKKRLASRTAVPAGSVDGERNGFVPAQRGRDATSQGPWSARLRARRHPE